MWFGVTSIFHLLLPALASFTGVPPIGQVPHESAGCLEPHTTDMVH